MHKKIIRDDGSVIILVPRKESMSVMWEVMFKVGSRQEKKSINGVSHFIEHLMFKGTTKRPSTKALSKELDSVGAAYNAFTGKDHTGYYIQTDAGHLELGIDLLSDMLHSSLFRKADMDRERNVIVEELNMYRDNPMIRIEEVFERAMYHGTALGMEIGGPASVIKNVLHKNLVAFRNRMYYPGNMVIGLAGKFGEKEAMRLVEKYFPVARKKDKAVVRPLKPNQIKPRIVLENKPTSQVQLMLGFPGFKKTHKDVDALTVLSVIVGGSMSSRLWIEIRENRGLAYDVRSSTESYEDVGHFAVQAGLDKDRIYEALELIKEELTKVKRKGVTREEFKRAKDNISGRLTLKFERPSNYMTYLLGQELLTGKVISFEEKLTNLRKVTHADVNRVAKRVISWKKSNLALIGPFKDKKKFLDIIS